MKIHLRGEPKDKDVWLNGKKLSLLKSVKIRNHSPTGFNWGYGGSGPAQLALAVCLDLYPEMIARMIYQEFKREYIAALPCGRSFDDEIEVWSPEEAVAKLRDDHSNISEFIFES